MLKPGILIYPDYLHERMGHLLTHQVPADVDVSMLIDAEEKLLFMFQIRDLAAKYESYYMTQ